MAKQKFNPMALDQILANALEETNALTTEISEFDSGLEEDDDIVPVPGVSPQINNMISQSSRRKCRLS
jgi:hypothetical protein